MNNTILEKANIVLNAVNYAKSHAKKQQNISTLDDIERLTNEIKSGNLEAKHNLKGIYNAKMDYATPDTDVSLMEIHHDGKSFHLQKLIDDLILEIEKNQGYTNK
jgi:hypothetical protein